MTEVTTRLRDQLSRTLSADMKIPAWAAVGKSAPFRGGRLGRRFRAV